MINQTVFLVEDDEAVRKTYERLLQKEGFAVSSYATPEEMLSEFDETQRGCLLLDLHLGEMSGLDLQRELADKGCFLPFIIITGYGEVPDATHAMRMGAIDFLEKPIARTLLIERIRQAFDEDSRRCGQEAVRTGIQNRLASLSQREREVLSLVIDGTLTKNIARQLGISVKTVEVHRSNIAKKMQVGSVVELVRLLAKYESIVIQSIVP